MSGLPDIHSELITLQEHLQETVNSLTRQQEILSMRGLSLEAAIMPMLNGLIAGLARAGSQIQDSDKELRQLRVLAETTALINSSLELDVVLERAMESVLLLTNAERSFLFLFNEAGELQIRVARRRSEQDQDDVSVSRTILRDVIQSGQPILTDNAAEDPRMASNQTAARFTLRSVMCVPLVLKGVIEGAIYVDNRLRQGVFNQRELTLLLAFANQIAVALDNVRLFSSVQQLLREIAQASELMQNVFASIGSGVITTDERDSITAYNASAAAIFQTPPEIAQAQPLRAVLPPLGGDFEEAFAQAQMTRTSSSLEAEVEIEGRGRVALSIGISPLKSSTSESIGVALLVDDLTAQRETEQTLTLLQRYLPPGMVDSIHEIAELGMGGERREVTCMFIDLGTRQRFAHLGAHELMDIMNRYLDATTAVIHNVGGVIDKYMGSEVMVLFNSQLSPKPDHAYQAVLAALWLSQRYQALDSQYGQGASVHRIGLHTGIATLGNVGGIQRRSFTALGDTINLAKRLQENARSGQIFISDAGLISLEQQIGGYPKAVRFVEQAPLQVKGRQQATRIYEVLHDE